MRADRLLSALLLLQAHARLTGRQLADRLEVSLRTVHRDMEALGAAGVPIYALRGARGGWQLDRTWRTDVPGLDEAELHGLLMAQPRVLGDPRLAAAAESALAKLMAALPAALRDKAASIRQRLHVDTTGWEGSQENLAMLPVVQDAVARDRQLTFHYRRPGREPSERTVHPLGLVAKGFTWYLVAQGPTGLRTFRVSRMDAARILDTPCHRPAGFDLAAFWRASTARFAAQRERCIATFRLEPAAARNLRTWHVATDAAPPDAAGWVTLDVHFGSENEACFFALGLGPRVDVLAPHALRTRVHADTTAAAARHRQPASPP